MFWFLYKCFICQKMKRKSKNDYFVIAVNHQGDEEKWRFCPDCGHDIDSVYESGKEEAKKEMSEDVSDS